MTVPHARSWLYVPASTPHLLDKAMAGEADAVVYDLEDGVAASAKNPARDNAAAAAAQQHPKPLWVRVNHPATPEGRADIAALRGAPVGGVRIPKAEDPNTVAATAGELAAPLHLLIESALGLRRVDELARCHADVVAVSLGEADLKADLRVRDSAALDYARQRTVAAARAAGLASPVHSVWTDVRDTSGLAVDSRRARDHGMFGRSVIHPCQIDPVNAAFTPDPAELKRARALVGSLREGGPGGWLDENGRFVDEAVLAQARWVIELAESLPDTPSDDERSH